MGPSNEPTHLPKVNERMEQSQIMRNHLEFAILSAIDSIEKEHNYEFERYEVDNVLLGMVKRNHEGYLRYKFGPIVIFNTEQKNDNV